VEALIRWAHPELGLLSPDAFIPIAEETGLIVPIGAWVLREACNQARSWKKRGLPSIEVAVNVSGRQLAQSDIASTVSAALGIGTLEPVRICLEVTESLLMTDPDEAAEVLYELRKAGVTLAIDDFGTGYSSLAYLKWFPVDKVKIDRSFVSGVATVRADSAIVETVIDLAHALEFEVVAEGVETVSQYARLVDLGCDRAQGFLFARPQPAELITEWIESGELSGRIPVSN
jgi:EAL domain-containing protein (putative c-di-GMP-specific phosphodiesterase class I)